MKEIKQAKKLKKIKKINWKFYKPYRDVLVDKKNDFLSKMFDRKKEKVNTTKQLDLTDFYEN